MRAQNQKVYEERRGFDTLNPDRIYAVKVRFYVKLKNERHFNLDVFIGTLNGLFSKVPWDDELVALRSSEFQAPHTYLRKYAGDFVYVEDEGQLPYFELYSIPGLKKGQLQALEKWAESFAKALLFEEIPGMVISTTRAEVSFHRSFGTFYK